ncbi:MAG TPA: heme exporter protein CcmB, partial [Chitinophagales bacterium]|nr:heme exporter protein CcmB [Chitinophagales bacterium]
MSLLQQIGLLITKDLRLEWRQRYALSGILLYVVSTVMVVYLSLSNPQPAMWTAVLWIILLFASVNAVAKSFMQESTSRQL